MARLTPVLPTVPSVTRPLGFSRPSASASVTICSATRSFTLPPGLRNSALPRIYGVTPAVSKALGGRLPRQQMEQATWMAAAV